MEMSDRPLGPPTARVLDLVRCPAKGGLRGIITCAKITGTYTHFWGGKTIPCGGSLCQACDEDQSRRWHGYFGIITPDPQRHQIVETTVQACEQIWAWEEINGSILGAKITLARRGEKVNGKICVSLDVSTRGKFRLPKEPDIEKNLRIIWGLDSREIVRELTDDDRQALAAAQRATLIDGHHPNPNL